MAIIIFIWLYFGRTPPFLSAYQVCQQFTPKARADRISCLKVTLWGKALSSFLPLKSTSVPVQPTTTPAMEPTLNKVPKSPSVQSVPAAPTLVVYNPPKTATFVSAEIGVSRGRSPSLGLSLRLTSEPLVKRHKKGKKKKSLGNPLARVPVNSTSSYDTYWSSLYSSPSSYFGQRVDIGGQMGSTSICSCSWNP